MARLHAVAWLFVLTTLVACAATSRSAPSYGDDRRSGRGAETLNDDDHAATAAPQTVRYKLDAVRAGEPQGALAIRGREAELALDDPRGISTGTVDRGDVTRMTFAEHGVLECTDNAAGLTCTCGDERARRWTGNRALRFERLVTQLADR